MGKREREDGEKEWREWRGREGGKRERGGSGSLAVLLIH